MLGSCAARVLRHGGAFVAKRRMTASALTHTIPHTERPGELWAWGHSDEGSVRTPTNMADSVGPCVHASCGLYHYGALTADGQLLTWGRGEGGRLGNREGTFSMNRGGAIPLHNPDPFPVDVTTPLIDPESEYGVREEDMPFIVGSALGGLHTLILMSDGRVMACGFRRLGQLGIGMSSSGTQHSPTQILGLRPAVSIAAGGSHSAAVCDDGNVYTWGRSAQGRLGFRNVPETVHEPKCVEVMSGLGIGTVVCGGFHTAALAVDGKRLWMWGGGENGELGNSQAVNQQEPSLVQELQGEPLKAVSLGGFHSAAITESGDVLTWGMGTVGQLGHGNIDRQLIPRRVVGLPPAQQVSCGGSHTMVLDKEGKVWAFGTNGDYQLGIPKISTSLAPRMIESFGDHKVSFVSAGGALSCAIVATD
mmetsp:Transcript_21449/g.41725  ORF Transcript_21449/g.41725 Transcript_21449/m.41725 type:complete len:420 (+) Transcript_21449:196-1455(+)|eukprot:CAMPEP_0173399106 /NCGR_PEP_ID=MMETSP1356-20130122/44019_1 /TAXON_ID=77927 ORGANISM="Hemiselmis virescens, Strain PCC157" /NCGR_SAMPLE_ID=MMETSP1356 /ASSEMBLY_ACC=CAM_ASM_000847 /LENGTH=419 /DNA_ID=CAMNT_0014358761 /DNA_START=113 /DNA_END=1372 /DNA_ORIENTATION=-